MERTTALVIPRKNRVAFVGRESTKRIRSGEVCCSHEQLIEANQTHRTSKSKKCEGLKSEESDQIETVFSYYYIISIILDYYNQFSFLLREANIRYTKICTQTGREYTDFIGVPIKLNGTVNSMTAYHVSG